MRDRAQLLRALLVLGLGGFFFILFVGVNRAPLLDVPDQEGPTHRDY